ncbi:hypothetical protein EV121DRAFT_207467 [Schizophyllum commune]
MPHTSARTALAHAASVANLAMLRTYFAPSHVQIEAIKESSTRLEYELAFLPPNDIPPRKEILAQLDIHRSVLAPIRRLPKELLIEIFFLVVYELPLSTLHAAALIARVCTTWREVAHGLKKFWTKVVVKSVRDFDGYCELFLPLTEGRLSDLRCDDRKVLSSLWDHIEPYASRWRSISLEGRLGVLPDLRVIYLDNLERLVVDVYDAPISTELSALDFVVAPHLRHIALTLDTLLSERQLHVPIAQTLTSLEIYVMSPFPVTYTLPLLRACADTLQTLALKVRYPLDGPEGSYPTNASETFDMKALTRIRLVDPACALLNHINAPIIEALILSNAPAYTSQSLRRFLTQGRASHSLLVLRVYKVEEQEISAWVSCLELMDNLLQLHFDELLSNREFLKLLILRADRPALLPSLRGVAIWRILRVYPELRGVVEEVCDSRAVETTIDGRHAFLILGFIKDC